jgi:hypothetical protein
MTHKFNRDDGTFAQVAFGDLNSTSGIFSSSIASAVALNSTSAFFDGPAVSVGPAGTWHCSGTVTVADAAGSGALMVAKLWDGSTVAATAAGGVAAGLTFNSIALSGILTNPAGNVRISVNDTTTTSGRMVASANGVLGVSNVTAVRIA